MFKNEARLMKLIEHPHVISLLDYSEGAEYFTPSAGSKKVCYMAMELAERGNLIDLIEEYGPFGERISRLYFKQLIQTLEHMHSQG
mmetsp:Transcript_6738/g.7675  ORF Transcript_6738/g.7675 Transcript_6738/m.7675 type:complete len:86 (-) Transcript_6738:474-731(-)